MFSTDTTSRASGVSRDRLGLTCVQWLGAFPVARQDVRIIPEPKSR